MFSLLFMVIPLYIIAMVRSTFIVISVGIQAIGLDVGQQDTTAMSADLFGPQTNAGMAGGVNGARWRYDGRRVELNRNPR
ncbi:hypothetical protein [Nocardioides cynanchi]|uniref:hypothetical protein n=1 Tax=Nocardioides cynanchi TaxID=2558918 RepID=UPI00177C3AB3|nr:hypothetical protein [Nocardioides cynanchi]